MDPAVVAAQPMALPSGSEFSAAPGLMAASGGAPERQAASQPEGVQQPQLESSYSAGNGAAVRFDRDSEPLYNCVVNLNPVFAAF